MPLATMFTDLSHHPHKLNPGIFFFTNSWIKKPLIRDRLISRDGQDVLYVTINQSTVRPCARKDERPRSIDLNEARCECQTRHVSRPSRPIYVCRALERLSVVLA